jgi:hypothetical protein
MRDSRKFVMRKGITLNGMHEGLQVVDVDLQQSSAYKT